MSDKNAMNAQKIFGTKTKKDWEDIRDLIKNEPQEKSHWSRAFKLLDLRLKTRYCKPIEKISFKTDEEIANGQGFAVMTLICSLIEFLQTCYEGVSFKLEGAVKQNYEYGNDKASKKFKKFLTQQKPFNVFFNQPSKDPSNPNVKTLADDFYANVRCGLLHEAATKNNWVIRTKISGCKMIDIESEKPLKIIYRDTFVEAIKVYVNSYGEKIKNDEKDDKDNSLRYALARKLDALCDIKADKTDWWQEKLIA